MDNPLQPRRSVEQCEKDPSWDYRCEFNFIAAPQAVFGALFTILTALHVYLAVKYRKRGGIYFSLITASFWSAVGYWVKFGMGGPQPDGLGQLATAYLLIILAVFCMRPVFLILPGLSKERCEKFPLSSHATQSRMDHLTNIPQL